MHDVTTLKDFSTVLGECVKLIYVNFERNPVQIDTKLIGTGHEVLSSVSDFSPNGFKKIRLGGLAITVSTRDEAAKYLVHSALHKRPGVKPLFVTSANGQVLSMCARDPAIRALFDKADLIHADGQPMVVASRRYCSNPLPERVATTDLFHDVAKVAERWGASFYILGACEAINARATANMKEIYPMLSIAGRRNGYFNDDEELEIVRKINVLAPDILWVSLGAPLEQQFICRNIAKLTNVGVIKTAGGLLDFVAGERKRAPKWMQDWSLEWLYRTWLEPTRLGPRYLETNLHSVRLLATQSGDL